MILQCSKIEKTFISDPVLSNCSFYLEEKEKAAIVGVNGAGKSTLLKIIIGELEATGGTVTLQKQKTIGYLAQQEAVSTQNTIYQEVISAKQHLCDLWNEIKLLEKSMKNADSTELTSIMNRYTSCTHEFEQDNGYALVSEVTGILKGLGFSEEDFDKPVASLSGGQKTRVALSKLLLTKPDLIMLDEPTNHLDMDAISWLEGYLSNYDGAVLIVAHDRYFLDKIVTKVIEIERTRCEVFRGNYTEYAKKKQFLREDAMRQYLKQQQEIQHQEDVIKKLKSFNREKSIKRAESREKQLDKINRIEKPIEDNHSMHITITPSIESGNDVLSIEDLSKSFSSMPLFSHLSFSIKRGERVALIGRNGTGKTTILKMINQLISPDHGTIQLGAKVHIGYYDQDHQVLHPDKTLFEEISDEYPDLNNTRIRTTLAAFLFTGEDVYKRIRDLSGGERGRMSLAKLMLSNSNFLILDEPTNHLDMVSKEILENALISYEGTVLFVSHDRYFINKTCTRILDLTNQILVPYIGNYDYYLEKHDELTQAALSSISKGSAEISVFNTMTDSEQKDQWKAQKAEQANKRKTEAQLKKAEDEIEKIENRLQEISSLMSRPEIATDAAQCISLSKESDTLNEQLLQLMETWESLQ